MNKGPNWQGIVVMLGIFAWTANNVFVKLTKLEATQSWWAATAPATIFAGMVITLYLVARVSIWVGRSSGLTK